MKKLGTHQRKLYNWTTAENIKDNIFRNQIDYLIKIEEINDEA